MRNNFIRTNLRNILYKYLINKYLSEGLILDIGCGEGIFSEKIKDRCIGIDITKNILDKDDKICANAISLPFKSNVFSGAFSADLIEHITNPFTLISESNRVLKLNSNFIILTPSPSYSFWNEPTHIRPYTPIALKRLFVKCGFEPVKTFNLYKTNIGIGKKVKNLTSLNKFWTTDKILGGMQY